MIIRTAWLYSIYGNNFVKTMLRLGRERETLGVVFDQIGTPTYANDLARAIFAAISQGIVPGIYHFSNEGVCSWYVYVGYPSSGRYQELQGKSAAYGRIPCQGIRVRLILCWTRQR